MNLGASFTQAIEILKRNRATMETVSKDDQALMPGLIFLAAVGLIGGIPNGIGAAIGSAIILPIFSFIGIGILFILAKIFKGEGGYMELWRPMAFAHILMVVNVLSFIPILGALIGLVVGIYLAVVAVIVLQVTQKLSQGAAIAVVLIPVVLLVLLAILGVVVGGAAMLGAMGAASAA